MSLNMTEVRLLRVPLESDYKQTLYFETNSEQEQYFMGKTMKTGVEFTYQRKDRKIRWHEDYDSVIGCNYVMYKNKAHSDKWYYAFITNIEYISDGRCDISIETDVIQTWLFDYVVQPSFVEREHVKDDVVGKHLLPESLETGEYIVYNEFKNEDLLEKTIIIACTVDLNSGNYDGVAGNIYGGVYSGVRYYKVTVSQANDIIKQLAKEGKPEAITSIFTAPSVFTEVTGGGTYPSLAYSEKAESFDWLVDGVSPIKKPTNIDFYEPRNKKLLTYPYCYLLMSNNSGGSAVFHYEYFDEGDECDFRIYGSHTPGYSVRLVPKYYKGCLYNNQEGLNLGKLPICSWATDVYTAWLAQNAVNIQVGIQGGIAHTALSGISVAGTALSAKNLISGGTETANALHGVVSGLEQIGGVLGEKYAHSLQPPQAEGNLNSGDVTFAMDNLTFTAYQMTIRREYAEIIDKYFDMYGYQVNLVHKPFENHRENYWFTKTVDVNIDGLVPMEDMARIKTCYNNGITFWKNPLYIGNYEVSNEII